MFREGHFLPVVHTQKLPPISQGEALIFLVKNETNFRLHTILPQTAYPSQMDVGWLATPHCGRMERGRSREMGAELTVLLVHNRSCLSNPYNLVQETGLNDLSWVLQKRDNKGKK